MIRGNVSLNFIADQLQAAGKTAVEKDELEAQLDRLNALQPAKIDNRWSTNAKVIEKRLPCHRAAHFGKCDKGDACRFSRREYDCSIIKYNSIMTIPIPTYYYYSTNNDYSSYYTTTYKLNILQLRALTLDKALRWPQS